MLLNKDGRGADERKSPKLPLKRRLSRILAVNVAVLFCCLAFQLFIRVGLVEQSYKFEQLRRKAVTNDERLRALKYSLASNRRSSSIMKRASAELGLETLSPERIRRINESGEV